MQRFGADTWRIWLSRDPEPGLPLARKIDPHAPFAWKTLESLKRLIEVNYEGTDPGVLGFAAKRKLKTLRWNKHEQSVIDASNTLLDELSLDAAKPLTVKLPKTLTTLRLVGVSAWSQLKFESADGGAKLAIWAWAPKKPIRALQGLPNVHTFSVGATRAVDLAFVKKHPEIRHLEIFGDDAGVELENLKALASLKKLEDLELRNVFHTDLSTLPVLNVTIDGIRAEAAAALKARWPKTSKLAMRGVRTDAWLAANADNPFREWAEEYDRALGARATKAYKTAVTALDKAKSRKEVEKVLKSFVESFNAVEDRIDTIMREEVDDALARLADRAKLGSRESAKLFDAWRDF